jgi:hypothetical protein
LFLVRDGGLIARKDDLCRNRKLGTAVVRQIVMRHIINDFFILGGISSVGDLQADSWVGETMLAENVDSAWPSYKKKVQSVQS